MAESFEALALRLVREVRAVDYNTLEKKALYSVSPRLYLGGNVVAGYKNTEAEMAEKLAAEFHAIDAQRVKRAASKEEMRDELLGPGGSE